MAELVYCLRPFINVGKNFPVETSMRRDIRLRDEVRKRTTEHKTEEEDRSHELPREMKGA